MGLWVDSLMVKSFGIWRDRNSCPVYTLQAQEDATSSTDHSTRGDFFFQVTLHGPEQTGNIQTQLQKKPISPLTFIEVMSYDS